MTPDGKKRNPFAFLAFSGGRRICFGKTLAEYKVKYLAAYLTELFDFEFENPENYPGDKYPTIQKSPLKETPLIVKVFKRRDA